MKVTTVSYRAQLSLCALLVLVGCGSPESRYSQKNDAAPTLVLNPDRIADAVPQPTDIRKAGNMSPYTVNGVKYRVMPVSEAYRYKKRGQASWYGSKFHGHLTSNGEIYNMYEMSAAHKALPIPCYAKVTNLDNGRTAIVRVNDRGPFHSDRIIDLSYAAATKLGYMDKGVARVEVEVIDPGTWQAGSPAVVPEQEQAVKDAIAELPKPYLQAAALSEESSAQALSRQLKALLDEPVTVSSTERKAATLYRVRIGPLAGTDEAERISALLVKENLDRPHLVYE